MIKEALEFLADLKEKSVAPLAIPGDPRADRWLIEGDEVAVVRPNPPRDHRVGSLDELIALALRFAGEASGGSSSPVVWYDRDKVVLVIDDEGHRLELATLALESSDAFAVVRSLRQQKPWFKQPDFIRLLRIDLAGTLPPQVLLEKVRRLEIGQAVTTTINRRGESMGSEINARAGKDADPPDEVQLTLPVYKTMGEGMPVFVECTVELEVARPDPFRLLPRPDEIERVTYLAMASIAERLAGGLKDKVPFYFGQP